MIKKVLIILTLVLSFGIPLMAYSQGISQFVSAPIQSNPQKGDGERFVGNTDVQIVAPAASSTKIAGETGAAVPNVKTPETIVIPDKTPYVIQQSKPN